MESCFLPSSPSTEGVKMNWCNYSLVFWCLRENWLKLLSQLRGFKGKKIFFKSNPGAQSDTFPLSPRWLAGAESWPPLLLGARRSSSLYMLRVRYTSPPAWIRFLEGIATFPEGSCEMSCLEVPHEQGLKPGLAPGSFTLPPSTPSFLPMLESWVGAKARTEEVTQVHNG